MEHLENRELSWLKFNKRVLEEAVCPETPALERISFSAIYQSNLDEFFMVRVGSISEDEKDEKEKKGKKKKDKNSDMTASEQLDAVFTAVRRLQPSVEICDWLLFASLRVLNHLLLDLDDADDHVLAVEIPRAEVVRVGHLLPMRLVLCHQSSSLSSLTPPLISQIMQLPSMRPT